MKFSHFFLSLIFLVNFYLVSAQKVSKLWDSPRRFVTPESVMFSEENNIIYVANINGNPSEKDKNGFISKLNLDGEIVNLRWVTGLNAPKGMGIFEGKLYVSDIDQLVEIDITKGKVIKKYDAEKAKFLNDISIDASGNVYVSDMLSNCIYRFSSSTKSLEKWCKVKSYKNPNGVFVEENKLLVGVEDYVIKIDLATKEMTEYIKNTGGIDGLVPALNKGYFISDWLGKTHFIQVGKEKIVLTDTGSKKMNAADIDFIGEQNILLIPTFYDNRVSAYTVEF